MQLLALDQRDLDLRMGALEVERKGHAGDPLGRDGAGPAVELPPVQQQLAVPLRQVVGPGARPIGGDVRPDQVRFAVPKLDVGVLQLGPSLPQRLHLGAGEDQAGLGAVVDEVVVKGLPVSGNGLDGLVLEGRAVGCFIGNPAEQSTGWSCCRCLGQEFRRGR